MATNNRWTTCIYLNEQWAKRAEKLKDKYKFVEMFKYGIAYLEGEEEDGQSIRESSEY